MVSTLYILCMRVFVCVGVQTLFRDELLCLRAEQWAEKKHQSQHIQTLDFASYVFGVFVFTYANCHHAYVCGS